jgi:hypothetical protein
LLSALQNQPLFDQELPVVGTTVRCRRSARIWRRSADVDRPRAPIGGRYGTVPLAFDQVLAE